MEATLKSSERFNDDFLSYRDTLSLRLILAITILLFHAGDFFAFHFYDIAYLCVAGFFFLSGYGLFYNYSHKKKYLSTFLQKRYPAILIPFWIWGIIGCILITVCFATYDDFFTRFQSLFFSVPRWFVTELLVFYLIFFVSLLMLKEKLAILTIIVFSIVAMISLATYFDSIPYCASGMGFFIGVLWARHADTIGVFLKKYYYGFLFVLILLFLLHHERWEGYVGVTLFLGFKTILFVLILFILKMKGGGRKSDMNCDIFFSLILVAGTAICIAGLLFWNDFKFFSIDYIAGLGMIFIAVLITKIRPVDFILSKGGIISFEIYLCHWTIFRIIQNLDFTNNVYLLVTCSILLTIVVSIIAYTISRRILQAYNKKWDDYVSL